MSRLTSHWIGCLLLSLGLSACAGDQRSQILESAFNVPHFLYLQRGATASFNLYYVRTSDTGFTFNDRIQLTNGQDQSVSSPDLAIDPLGNPLVIFMQSDGSYSRLYYAASTDQGVSFSSPTVIDAATGSNVISVVRPVYDGLTQTLHVSFVQTAGAENVYYYSRSVAGGAFSTPVALSDPSETASSPDMRLDPDGHPFVAYLQESSGVVRLFCRRSLNYGQSFSNAVNCDANTGEAVNHVHIAFDRSRNPHVVFAQNLSAVTRVYSTKSSDRGLTFPTPQLIDANTGSSANLPRIQINESDTVFVLFNQGTAGFNRLYFTRSTDGGSTFSSPAIIDTDPTASVAIQNMTVGPDGNPYIIYFQGATLSAFFVKSTDQGSTFSTPLEVDRTDLNAVVSFSWPRIDVSSSGVIYVSFLQSEGAPRRHIVNYSTDGGVSFAGGYKAQEGTNTCGLHYQLFVRPHL